MRKGIAGWAWMCTVALLACRLQVAGAAVALPDFTALVKRTSPAVVNISTTQRIRPSSDGQQSLRKPPGNSEKSPFDDFFKHFFGDGEPPTAPFDARSLGSGFIISSDGYVLTNYHVVRNADQIIVRLSDRREFIARQVGYDERSDIALLKINASHLPVVRIGNSSSLQPGEWVVAIGSPFGFEHSVTAGIVSATGRSLPDESYIPFIQTDVAINPGNSGGPLFNLRGEVVGINSQIYSRTGGFMGLSFSIPIELAMDVVHQLKTTGHVTRGWLGVLIQQVTGELAESFGMDRPRGALVAQVTDNSPAQKAGLQVGDVIVDYSGHSIGTSSALPPLVGQTPVGTRVDVRVIRDGKVRRFTVTIGKLPDRSGEQTLKPSAAPEHGTTDRLGLALEDLGPGRARELGVKGGVIVKKLSDGPGADAGLVPGDVIVRLGHRSIADAREFRMAVSALPAGKTVPVLIFREGEPRFIALKMPTQN